MCATCKLNTWSKNKINSNYLFLRTNSATFAKFSVRIELFENTLTCFLKISGLYPGMLGYDPATSPETRNGFSGIFPIILSLERK